jgi:hypothetical protein
MNMFKKLGTAIALGAAAVLISGCAMGLPTKVTRYSAMPIPAGQSFYVVQSNGQPGGLEFGSFAALVAQQLEARGYVPAGTPQAADMLVKVGYGVDQGRTQIVEDPFYDPFYSPFYRGPYYYSRYGYWGTRSPFYWGWDDPFWYRGAYGYGFNDRIRSYTVYTSFLDMSIVRNADNAALFEGHAKARSQTDELGTLVPNLVEAMFTGFPGRNGETVRITVPARKR